MVTYVSLSDIVLSAGQLHGGYGEEKVPLSFIVADPTPVPSPLAAPPPVTGADDDDGMRPRLPTERWRRGSRGEERRGEERRHAHAHAHAPALAPSSSAAEGPARAPASADAPAPDSGSGGTPFIESSPAVPVPRGVRDTATILPMPAPGVKRQVLLAVLLSYLLSPRTGTHSDFLVLCLT
jgi:hypothetical protein